MAVEFDGHRQRRILDIIQQFLRSSLRERRDARNSSTSLSVSASSCTSGDGRPGLRVPTQDIHTNGLSQTLIEVWIWKRTAAFRLFSQ
jgi:hypothetical protein